MRSHSTRSRWVFPLALAAGAIGLGGLAAYSRLEPSTTVTADAGPKRRLVPPASGAFAHGGVPSPGTPQTRELFAKALPTYVIELDRWAKHHPPGQGPRDDAAAGLVRSKLLSPHAAEMLGDHVFASLGDVLDAADSAARAEISTTDATADQLAHHVRVLDDALAAANLGYWIDSEVLTQDNSRVVLMFTFAVLEVTRYQSDARALRALRLRRLDNLNWAYQVFGFTGDKRRDAVVLVDKIEERLITTLLPALAGEPSATALDLPSAARAEPWFSVAAKTGLSIARRDVPYSRELANVVSERSALFAQFNRRLGTNTLALPSSLSLPDGYRDQLQGIATTEELDKLAALESRLSSPQSRLALDASAVPLTRAVELHELQHRLDIGVDLPLPAALSTYVGPMRDKHGAVRPLAASGVAELSAYLAELARTPSPHLSLLQLVTFLFDDSMWGTAECYASLVILAAIAGELGESTSLVTDRRVNRAAVADLFASLAELPRARLSRAAHHIWEREFARRLPALDRVGPAR